MGETKEVDREGILRFGKTKRVERDWNDSGKGGSDRRTRRLRLERFKTVERSLYPAELSGRRPMSISLSMDDVPFGADARREGKGKQIEVWSCEAESELT